MDEEDEKAITCQQYSPGRASKPPTTRPWRLEPGATAAVKLPESSWCWSWSRWRDSLCVPLTPQTNLLVVTGFTPMGRGACPDCGTAATAEPGLASGAGRAAVPGLRTRR